MFSILVVAMASRVVCVYSQPSRYGQLHVCNFLYIDYIPIKLKQFL